MFFSGYKAERRRNAGRQEGRGSGFEIPLAQGILLGSAKNMPRRRRKKKPRQEEEEEEKRLGRN